MARKSSKKTSPLISAGVDQYRHDAAKRTDNPPVEYQTNLPENVAKDRDYILKRNRDLDPQLVWRGKDELDAETISKVAAPVIYIQENIKPKYLIDDLLRTSREAATTQQPELFSDFNGLPKDVDRTDFYQHAKNWTNRMILGDSLQVMASLVERERLRGQVQCVYMDPPYGIKFNSNFQWCVTSTSVNDGKNIPRETEMVKAYRDTWRDGINSYLSYLRDRFIVARDLLADSGSIFVQIGDENVHRVRAVLDEVFGDENFVAQITYVSTPGLNSNKRINSATNYILWFAKNKEALKYRPLYLTKKFDEACADHYTSIELENGERMSISDFEKKLGEPFDYDKHCTKQHLGRVFRLDNTTSPGRGGFLSFTFQGKTFTPGAGKAFKTNLAGMTRLEKANRIVASDTTIGYVRYIEDFPASPLNNVWSDTPSAPKKIYVVQTKTQVIERCVLMTTDPGDLVLDPTCGSGTTAYVAEQWGRRWITIDTSRIAIALARTRLMNAKFPYYCLADSREGQAEAQRLYGPSAASSATPTNDIRLGFVYTKVPHIRLADISNNANIDTIWDEYRPRIDPLRERLNSLLKKSWEEWEIPNETEKDWPAEAKKVHADFLRERSARQAEIDKSIAAASEGEVLCDKPIEDKKRIRVSGPFTVESVAPFREMESSGAGDFTDPRKVENSSTAAQETFTEMILREMSVSGVRLRDREDRITFTSLEPLPSDDTLSAEGKWTDKDGKEHRSAIFIGPEFGTVTRELLAPAARNAAEFGYDELISCAFNYGPLTSVEKIGRIPLLKVTMNTDLHMAGDLKTGKSDLFIVFGEPDIKIHKEPDNKIRVEVCGIDVYKPATGEIVSSNTDDIACWFIDTDYNSETFFVRQVYFLGQAPNNEALKNSLKAEINDEAWSSLRSAVSRPFDIPKTKQIAVKIIDKFGNGAIKVFKL